MKHLLFLSLIVLPLGGCLQDLLDQFDDDDDHSGQYYDSDLVDPSKIRFSGSCEWEVERLGWELDNYGSYIAVK